MPRCNGSSLGWDEIKMPQYRIISMPGAFVDARTAGGRRLICEGADRLGLTCDDA
jgi:hypothetical protein